MTLTKEEKDVMKILVTKELAEVKKDGKKIFISNSPFLHKVGNDDSDLDFLKSEVKYQHFLEKLLKKL
tara:strand:- start:338 stop:541 length:204 start_codon:yes stop_codon:yes gene_type:complete